MHITRLYRFPARYCRLFIPTPDGLSILRKEGYIPLEPLPIVGLASMEQTDENVDAYRRYTVKISALLKHRPSMPQVPMAYLAHTADAQQLIIGTAEPPYPLPTITDTYPDRASERAACTLTLTLTGSEPARTLLTP